MIIYLTLIDDDENRKKFETLYNNYKYFMFHWANKILRDHLLAEDAVQDSFIRIATNIDKIEIDNVHKLEKLLFVITKNVAFDIFKKRKNMISFEDISNFLPFVKSVDDTVSQDIIEKLIIVKIKSLPLLYREILELNLIYELKPIQISAIIGLNRHIVSKRVERGKKILRGYLEESGVNMAFLYL